MDVLTTKGLIPVERLEINDIVKWGANSREIATEWYLDGELVKRDVHIIVLAPLSLVAAAGKV